MQSDFWSEARYNLNRLGNLSYPGRGIVVGLDATSEYLLQIYWIMGRSENSRNRIFKANNDKGRLYTVAADPAKVKDPSLIIYNAMLEKPPYYFVSNGNQTDTVAERYGGRISLDEALADRTYEPDEPNFTQRITAVSRLHKGVQYAELSILRKSRFSDVCDRATYQFGLHPGIGFCITTYENNIVANLHGKPLVPFRGDPLPMVFFQDMGLPEIAEWYWNKLNEENRVSLAMKVIERGNGRSYIHIINKYKEI